ncbi:hypothetical protein CBL_20757 [Carabus blaptoides fortunei]
MAARYNKRKGAGPRMRKKLTFTSADTEYGSAAAQTLEDMTATEEHPNSADSRSAPFICFCRWVCEGGVFEKYGKVWKNFIHNPWRVGIFRQDATEYTLMRRGEQIQHKNKHGRRFTLDEKIIALSLLKHMRGDTGLWSAILPCRP